MKLSNNWPWQTQRQVLTGVSSMRLGSSTSASPDWTLPRCQESFAGNLQPRISPVGSSVSFHGHWPACGALTPIKTDRNRSYGPVYWRNLSIRYPRKLPIQITYEIFTFKFQVNTIMMKFIRWINFVNKPAVNIIGQWQRLTAKVRGRIKE